MRPKEAFDHAVGLRLADAGKAMLDAKCCAPLIERMRAAGITPTAAVQAVGELLAVVGQEAGDLDGTRPLQRLEKRRGRTGAFVRLQGDVYPAGCPLDRDEQVAPAVCARRPSVAATLHRCVRSPAHRS